MDYFFVICLAVLTFFVISIISRKSSHISDHIFIFWLLLVLLAEITFFLSSQDLYEDYHVVYEIVCGTHVLHGAAFFFYILTLIRPSFRFARKHLLHLLPFLFYVGYKMVVKSMNLVDCLDEGGCSHSDNIYAVISVYIKLLILSGYVAAGQFLIWKFRKISNNDCLTTHRYRWINSVGYGVLILISLVFIIKLFANLGVRFIMDEVMVINIIVSVFVLSFISIYTNYAFVFSDSFDIITQEKEDKSIKSEDIDNTKWGEQYEKIYQFIDNNKLFLDGDLTLRKLADLSETPEHIISQSINRIAQRSYSDFINSYRINYFLEKVKNREHETKTLLSLAYECGFNSKSSFNRVFKQHYNTTPSEYIKSMGH